MQVIEMLAPLGHNCRCGESLWGFRGITVHNTSNWSNGANAIEHANLLRGGWKDKYIGCCLIFRFYFVIFDKINKSE